MDEIERVSVRDLIDGAIVDDEWLAPLAPNLRTSLYWSGVGMAVAIPVGLAGTTVLASWAHGGFFFFLGPLAVFLLNLLRSPVGIGVNIVALALVGLLYWQSNGLVEATIPWHRLGLVLVGIGGTDILAMTLPLAIVVVNLVVWIVMGIVALAIVFAVLSAAASS